MLIDTDTDVNVVDVGPTATLTPSSDMDVVGCHLLVRCSLTLWHTIANLRPFRPINPGMLSSSSSTVESTLLGLQLAYDAQQNIEQETDRPKGKVATNAGHPALIHHHNTLCIKQPYLTIQEPTNQTILALKIARTRGR